MFSGVYLLLDGHASFAVGATGVFCILLGVSSDRDVEIPLSALRFLGRGKGGHGWGEGVILGCWSGWWTKWGFKDWWGVWSVVRPHTLRAGENERVHSQTGISLERTNELLELNAGRIYLAANDWLDEATGVLSLAVTVQ